LARFFKGFYNGFDEEHTIWFAYDDEDEFDALTSSSFRLLAPMRSLHQSSNA
jgi:hypothetical protein